MAQLISECLSMTINLQKIQSLIEGGIDVNYQSDNGMTALMWLCYRHVDTSIIRLLIDSGANVNLTDIHGNTALHQTCFVDFEGNRLELLSLLVENGINVDAQNINGFTALMMLAESRSSTEWLMQELQLLIEYGADVNFQNNNGDTLLILCVREALPSSIISYLISQGAQVNTANNAGETPLAAAFRCWGSDENVDVEVAVTLIENGATLGTKTRWGRSSYDLIYDYGYECAYRLIISYVDLKKKNKVLSTENARMEMEIQLLKKENQFYKETISCYPEKEYIEELKKSFHQKYQELTSQQ